MSVDGERRIGLVLGGGGVVGAPYEAAVLCEIESATGWDPRTATVIVGTSAGALLGAALAHGRTAADALARYTTTTEDDSDPLPIDSDWDVTRQIFELWADGEPDSAAKRKITRLAAEASRIAPERWIDTIGRAIPSPDWPAADLRIVTTEVGTARRVAWTGDDGAPLLHAAAASAAVPGIFPPVPIQGERYIDGIVHSASSLDVLAGDDLSDVLYVGPMVGSSGILLHASTALASEQAILLSAGTSVQLVIPGDNWHEADIELMSATSVPAAIEFGRDDGARAATELGAAFNG